jgi:hypothetical protein
MNRAQGTPPGRNAVKAFRETGRSGRQGPVWWTAALAASVLLALGGAYWLTYEPAARIGIRWQEGLAAERQAELERRFRLVNRTIVDDRLAYDLLDTSPANLRALVEERDIYDTDGISRRDATLPPDYRYGESWMWVAHRTPVLRVPGVVEGIGIACVLLLIASAGVLIRSRRSSKGEVRSAK